MTVVQDSTAGATFVIKVHPRAKKDEITGQLADALKISITAPPVEGRANEACIEFLAEVLKVPRTSITIAAGQNSRRKTIRVSALSAAEVRRRLGI